MKLPKTFVTDKNLEEKTKELAKEREPKKKEDVPEKINILGDVTKYVSNSIIPVYGYDDKKRIHSIEMTIKEAVQHKIEFGKLNLIDNNPIFYQGLYFNRSDMQTEQLSLDLCLNMRHLEYEITKESAEKIKTFVNQKKNYPWSLVGIYNQPGLVLGSIININIPKEILWVFETFKEFKPVIHGGALRDLYLGIGRTGDIDVEVSPDRNEGEKKLYKLVHKVMDKVDHAQKGKISNDYYGAYNRTISQYIAKKEGIQYHIAGETFPRYLSTEELGMGKPGELWIHYLTKNDLDNKQFRFINTYEIPERILEKISKLQNLGLTFLPEDPFNLSRKINPEDLSEKKTKNSFTQY